MPVYAKELIRTVHFRPYLKGKGPTFKLVVYDLNSTDHMGKNELGYCLTQREPGGRKSQVVFEGSDFACSPLHGVDEDATVKALMGFLTLRPGDTDKEYFDKYTEAQLEFASAHSESLWCAVETRFGRPE